MAINGDKKVIKGYTSKFYFGGMASAMAATCTHPLDLLKVHLITQQKRELGLLGMGVKTVRENGFFSLYNGISASILRQLTYSLTRFAIYETYKDSVGGDKNMSFGNKVLVSAGAGFLGGIVGNPGDMVNVRMQNDMKTAKELRRNYKHAIDGLYRVCREEGALKLMNGVSMTATRAAAMTVGQLAMYDTFKALLMSTDIFGDNVLTHTSASVSAATVATFMTQPFDVMKTRLMNAPPGTYSGLMACGLDVLKNGPLGFFKGVVPAFVRLGPHTVLTFVFLEQLKRNLGKPIYAENSGNSSK